MTTYHDVLEAFEGYKASRSQKDWNKLWFLCEERMAALVKTKAKGLSVPLDAMDLMDLIRDASIRVLRRLKEADDVTEDYISVTFYNENRTAFEEFNRINKRWQRMNKAAGILNSANHVQ
jgi:hypothetical protein